MLSLTKKTEWRVYRAKPQIVLRFSFLRTEHMSTYYPLYFLIEKGKEKQKTVSVKKTHAYPPSPFIHEREKKKITCARWPSGYKSHIAAAGVDNRSSSASSSDNISSGKSSLTFSSK